MDLLKLYHDEDSIADTSSDHLSTDSPDMNDIYEEPSISPRIGVEFQVELPLFERKAKCLGSVRRSVCIDTEADIGCLVSIGLDIPVMWVPDRDNEAISGATAIAENACTMQSVNLEGAHEMKFQGSSVGRREAEISKTHGTYCEASTYEDELLVQNQDHNKKYSPIPGLPITPWTNDERNTFILGLYIFGKSLVQLRRFMGCKKMGDVLSFYYGNFYRSVAHRRWSECRKMRSRRCILGQRIFSGWRQNELLQRLDPSLSEASRGAVLEATRELSEGRVSLEEYVYALKSTVGVKVLVEAVGIGVENYDLTGVASDPARANQAVSIRAEIPIGKACSSLTSGDIIKFLTGDFRLSKAKSNDLFWEAVWPRLLAKGWHSEQPKNHGSVTSRHALVFLMPGVKKFSGKLVKGKHYFDSVSDVLNKVASDPRLLELEVDGPKGESSIKDEYGWHTNNKMDQNGTSDEQHRCYLRPRLQICNSELMKFTVVDTSLVQGEPPYRVRELRSLPVVDTFGYGASGPGEVETDSSEDQPSSEDVSLTDQESDPNFFDDKKFGNSNSSVSKGLKSILSNNVVSVSKRRMPTNRQNADGQCPNLLSNADSVRGLKCQSGHGVKCGKPNYLSPVLKRQRLTACRYSESGCRTVSYSSGNQVTNEVNCLSTAMEVSDTFVAVAGPSKGKLLTNFSARSSPSESNEYIASGNCFSACGIGEVRSPCEAPHPRDLIDLNLPQFPPDFDVCEPFNAEVADNQDNLRLKFPSLPSERGQNLADPRAWENSNGMPVEQHPNVNARRQSTRNRPLTTRALEALASGFLTTRRRCKGTKATSSGNVASRSNRHLCKTVETSTGRTVDHGDTAYDLMDAKLEAMDEECSSNTDLS
uniref:Arginine-glutamic acid dipeptide repeats protein n=2 Tax=Anthurium amnicola TaxID=1678845 RepID=A0A1D1ZEZ0_9ARAE